MSAGKWRCGQVGALSRKPLSELARAPMHRELSLAAKSTLVRLGRRDRFLPLKVFRDNSRVCDGSAFSCFTIVFVQSSHSWFSSVNVYTICIQRLDNRVEPVEPSGGRSREITRLLKCVASWTLSMLCSTVTVVLESLNSRKSSRSSFFYVKTAVNVTKGTACSFILLLVFSFFWRYS